MMSKQSKAFLLSLLTPGLGYLQNGDKKSFYKTIIFFFSIFAIGIGLRLVVSFLSFASYFMSLTAIYIFALIDATLKARSANPKIKSAGYLKFIFVLSFLLITGLSFANRRTLMGFDIMSMDVPVMQPTVLQGDKFLIDTWAYKRSLPKRGDIIVHSFNQQPNLYLNRVIAVENDKIEIKNGVVFINDQILIEPYILSANITRLQSKDMHALIIPQGHHFVMGDNRDASFGDSRFSGTITIDKIAGKATDIIASKDKSGIGTTLK